MALRGEEVESTTICRYYTSGGSNLYLYPPLLFWLGCCPCEKEKLVQPQQMMARVCVYFWGCWPTGLMYNKRAAIHQDDTWRCPRALSLPVYITRLCTKLHMAHE